MMWGLKNILFSLILISPISFYAYELTFNNFTDKTLIIMSKKRAGIKERYYQIVPPQKSVIQAWSDANCLESLQWAELNPSLPNRGGLDFVDNNKGGQISSDKQTKFDESIFSKKSGKGLYVWNNLKIVMVPTPIYEATKKSAVELVRGFDKMVCGIVDYALLAIKDATFGQLLKAYSALEEQVLSKEARDKNINKVTDSISKAFGVPVPRPIDDVLHDAGDAVAPSVVEQMRKLKAQIEKYVNEHLDFTSSKRGCFSNLAQIAQAAGKIHGISICKNRDFVIFDTGEKDPLTGMPLLLAETQEGS